MNNHVEIKRLLAKYKASHPKIKPMSELFKDLGAPKAAQLEAEAVTEQIILDLEQLLREGGFDDN